jgi:hypothetical protein
VEGQRPNDQVACESREEVQQVAGMAADGLQREQSEGQRKFER